MRVVILLAGMGRRISDSYGGMHKALIPLDGRPLISYLLENIRNSGISDVVIVLGYHADEVEQTIRQYSGDLDLHVCINNDYARTNNLASLMAARELLVNQNFIVVNGDMVFDYHILTKLSAQTGTQVVVDCNVYENQLDSPRVLIRYERIIDLGRHMTIEEADGYAVGIYRFGADHTLSFFAIGEEMLKKNPQAGFHDPLRRMFDDKIILPCFTDHYAWMDVDEIEDVEKAECLLNKMKEGSHFE